MISRVVFHRCHVPALADGISDNVAMIRLEEGPVVIAKLRGIDTGAIRMVLSVEVALEPLDDLTVANFGSVKGA